LTVNFKFVLKARAPDERFRKPYISKSYFIAMQQQDVENRLDRIEKRLGYMRENIVDLDVVVTEEKKLLGKSAENEKSGNLVCLEEIRDVRNKAR